MNRMIQRTKKNLRNRKGFTLIELIVVIVIIGILAAIVIPRLSGFTATAEERAAVADARTILTAMTTIYAEANDDADVTGLDEEDTILTDLTGPIKGKITGTTCNDGAISFTYVLGNVTIEVEDGSITATP